MDKKYLLQSSVIAGLIVAIFSFSPVLKIGNCFCCMWKILGGGFAVYLYYNYAKIINAEKGLIIGLYSGLFAGVFEILFIGLFLIFGRSSMVPANFNMHMQNLPIETSEQIIGFMSRFPLYMHSYRFISALLSNLIFVPVGALLTSIIFSSSNKNQSVTPPDSYHNVNTSQKEEDNLGLKDDG